MGKFLFNPITGQLDRGGVTLGTTTTTAAAGIHGSTHHAGGTDALAPNNISAAWALVLSTETITGDTTLSSGRNRRITLIGTGATANVDLPSADNQVGDIVTLIASFFVPSVFTIRAARGTPPFATLATLNASGQAFTFINIQGTATSWELRAVDTHTHAASAITTGTFDNARINFAAPAAIGNTTPAAGTFTTLAANNGTLTASAPVLDLAQTWNASGTTFTGLNLSLTNTASASASSYFNINLDAGQVFSIRRGESTTGATLITCGGSGLTWTARTRTGGGVGVNFSGIVGIGTNIQFGTGSSTTGGDVILTRDDAANTLALRNAANAQTFNIYNTHSSSTNHERGFLRWSSNVFQIGTEKGSGGGTARNLHFQTDGSTRLYITTGGNITIGNGDGTTQASSAIVWQGNARISATNTLTGVITLGNRDNDGFNRLQFGGTTSSFPALKRDSTALQARLANDSDFCPLQGQIRIHQNAVSETITATHTLTLFDAAGTAYKVPCVAA
jgi:hypothetical protein